MSEWVCLFDGSSVDAWRGFRQESFPDGWQIVEGELQRVSQAGDIITKESFENFELELEWRSTGLGNSGIFFRVSEDNEYVWQTGPEMQILNDAENPAAENPLHAAGANYGLHAPSENIVRCHGEWNQVRLRADGPFVEHWLNEKQIVSYELYSEDWKQRVAISKFCEMPNYAKNSVGHIALQDHGDFVAFRNIRIRRL